MRSAATVTSNAKEPALASEFIGLLVSSDGQAVLSADGQTPIVPAEAYGTVPDALKSSVVIKG